MTKAKSRIKKEFNIIPLLVLTDVLLWIAVFISIARVKQIEQIAYEYKSPEVIIVEVEKTQPEYVPSANTLKIIERNPGVAGKINRHYGSDWRKYAELIARESSFNPHAINPTSQACGLAQALPCQKMACELSDIDCQLKWIETYVIQRYGSIDNALSWHDARGWY